MTRAYYYLASDTMPYRNQAIEQYLLEKVLPDTVILYLWQNRRTVVIGRNQNCWQECRVEQLQRDGGFLARRRSGGGAVYHDAGNLNFTFIANAADYNLQQQQQVLLQAVQNLGIKAEINGRNDLVAAGRKFSGNAFYTEGGKKYHHGTLLVASDAQALSSYLSVPQDKLQSKGVASVQARVINLQELHPALTVARLQEQLLLSLGRVYGCQPEPLCWPELSPAGDAYQNSCSVASRLTVLEQEFAASDWLYGRRIPFAWRVQKRFTWGSLDLQLRIDRGLVTDAAVYSDALEADLLAALPAALQGCAFSWQALNRRLTQWAATAAAAGDCDAAWVIGSDGKTEHQAQKERGPVANNQEAQHERESEGNNQETSGAVLADIRQLLYEQLL